MQYRHMSRRRARCRKAGLGICVSALYEDRIGELAIRYLAERDFGIGDLAVTVAWRVIWTGEACGFCQQ